MGYRRVDINDLQSIYRRWMAAQSIQEISDAEGFDRKTVRGYIRRFSEIRLNTRTLTKSELHTELFSLLPKNSRVSRVSDSFQKHKQEIIDLITDKNEPVKPKTAFRIIKKKYDLGGSYESFKVFARNIDLVKTASKQFPRIETLPGQEVQIDYGSVGYHVDPTTGKNRRVYAFIGKLSSSRLPFVEFTYSQKQDSFVMSHVRMLEFFGGSPAYMTIDNLKSGVIKPDIYDPKLNKAYSEFAEYYGTFINPCIAGHSKGKAKVERQVQEIRELYRELHAVHPSFSLEELNKEALHWCSEIYGRREHGTTCIKPMEAFLTEEKPQLKALPESRFEAPVWKSAKVHPDQFFSFEKKRYSLPYKYRNTTVHIRKSGKLLEVYDKYYLFIRKYLISSRRAQWQHGDFPESYEAMMSGEYPQYLLRQVSLYGNAARLLAESILKPHAFLNARIVKALLGILETHKDKAYLHSVCYRAREKRIHYPKTIKHMMEEEEKQRLFDFAIPLSAAGAAMIRDISEYIN